MLISFVSLEKVVEYSVLTVLAAVVLICFNYLTAKHVQGTNEGWNLFIAYSETNFAEFGVYLTLIVLGPLMEELVCRGLLQHAFFKDSRWGLDLLFPSLLFALPHFSSLPSLADIFVLYGSGLSICLADTFIRRVSILLIRFILLIISSQTYHFCSLFYIGSWGKKTKGLLFSHRGGHHV